MTKWPIFLFLTLLFATSCGQNQNEFSSIRCFVLINNQEHNDATLATAMNNMSPGVFCQIQQKNQNGATYFSFKNNLGNQSTSIFNGKDQRMSFAFGFNNGIIVGFGNLDNPPVFYAYDLQCPNCFDWQALPRKNYPLSISSNGMASCPVCHRDYNLYTGGNIVKGDAGNKLTRYHASTAGPYGVLNVY